MKRLLFTIFIFLFIVSGVVSATDQKKFSLENQFKALSQEVFPEIRKYLKTVEVLPYNDKKGSEIVFHVEDIIVANENLFIAKKPVVSLFVLGDKNEIQFNISVVVAVFDDEKIANMNPIAVFGKYFYVKTYKNNDQKKLPNLKTPKLSL
jgi:hypothetical protein